MNTESRWYPIPSAERLTFPLVGPSECGTSGLEAEVDSYAPDQPQRQVSVVRGAAQPTRVLDHVFEEADGLDIRGVSRRTWLPTVSTGVVDRRVRLASRRAVWGWDAGDRLAPPPRGWIRFPGGTLRVGEEPG